jgi:hypothetical protein
MISPPDRMTENPPPNGITHGTRYAAEGAKLAWAWVDSELWPVKRFRELAGARRPHARCPVCEHPVSANICATRTDHYSHQPGSDCPIQRGEGVLHLNVKLHLLAELSKATALRIVESCAGISCWSDQEQTRVFAEGWDRVVPEMKVGSLRPDLLLLRGDHRIAAIEVHATNAVSPEKAFALGELGLPWIEVTAAEGLYSGETQWTADKPLRVECVQPGVAWECLDCHSERLEEAREARKRESAREREARMQLISSRVYDGYHVDGRHFREIFYLDIEFESSRPVSVRIRRKQRGDTFIDLSIRDGDLRVTRKQVKAKIANWEAYLRDKGWHVDKPEPWAKHHRAKGSTLILPPARYVKNRGKEWVPAFVGVPPLPAPFTKQVPSAAQPLIETQIPRSAAPPGARATASQPAQLTQRLLDPVRVSRRLVDWYREHARNAERKLLTRQIWSRETHFEGYLGWDSNPRPFVSVCSPTETDCASALDDAFEFYLAEEAWNGNLADLRTPWIQNSLETPQIPWTLSERYYRGEDGEWHPYPDDLDDF